MRKTLLAILLALCFAIEASGQTAWLLPKLKELDQSNTIEKSALHLSATETILLQRLTLKEISECAEDPGPDDPKIAKEVFNTLRVGRVTMKARTDPALVVQGGGACMCGAVGNCPFWLISEGLNPRLLLKAEGIQSFYFQKGTAGAHFTLLLGSHNSAMATDLQRFRFNGFGYKPTDCATINWDDWVGKRLNPPHITSRPCR